MVFHSVPESETRPPPRPSSSMASPFSPPKSQPLHNFPLSNLKWSMNQSNTQRLRKPLDSAHHSDHRPGSPQNNDHRRSGRPGLSPLGKNEGRLIKISYRTANSSGSGNSGRDDGGKTVSAAATTAEIPSSTSIESSEKKQKVKKEEKVKASNSHSQHQTVLIRLPAKSKVAPTTTDAADAGVEDEIQCTDEVAKTWNLRPRRPVTKPPNAANVQESKPQPQNQPELAVIRAAPEEKVAKKRQTFSVSLSKEDIERDFLVMTGSKPPRRPKKRARNVQKLLDVAFPGLWLTSVTPDLYRVPDPPLKG